MRDGQTRRVSGPAKPSGAAVFLSKHRVTLVVLDGGAAGTEYELDRARTIIGRGPAVDIAIDDATMSRQHAALEIATDGVHARDLGSTNGVRLNGERVAAASLMEPWISVAQKLGMRILIESHSTRAEAAGDDLDGETLKKMFRAQARAVEKIEKDPRPYIHYFIRETGGLLKPEEFQAWRLLHAAPQPYTRERFDDTYHWTVKWNMTVPGATYENTVDNRAWQ